MEIVRNLARHKTRTALTLFGIVIGILAVTVMGSITEYFSAMIDNGVRMAGTAITINPQGGIHSLITESDVRRVERVPGVRAVVSVLTASLSGGAQIGAPTSVYGMPPDLAYKVNPAVVRGRWLQRGDTFSAVIGWQVARDRKLEPGSTLTWRNHELTVVGIMQETQTQPDNTIVVPIEVVRHIVEKPNSISFIYALPENEDRVQASALARRIGAAVDTVKVQTLEESLDAVRSQLGLFNAIMLSGAVIAAIVGGLAVINTMIMSVNERTREIGVKKAIGAGDGEIVSELLGEAALLGLLGGLIGLLLGMGLASLLNASTAGAMGGAAMFVVTPRLALTAVGFAVALGAVGGLYPAWSAARLDPVEALREE